MHDKVVELKNKFISTLERYMKFGAAEDEKDPEYDPNFDAGYKQADVDACGKLLDKYFSALSKTQGDSEKIMAAVKDVVVGLNELNAKCDYTLIETEQREQLHEIITAAAKDVGLPTDVPDITEEWREW